MKDPSSLGLFIGTSIQERIALEMAPALFNSPHISALKFISLQNYYRLGLKTGRLSFALTLKDMVTTPWYDRSPALKFCSLLPFIYQLGLLSRRTKYFLCFVDTGILERVAIKTLKGLGCRMIVLQDALKRRPKHGTPKSLTWFGGGEAHLYLLMGQRYLSMTGNNRAIVVGSPVYDNQVNPQPPGGKILFVNQCFARYGEMSEHDELSFVRQVVKTASPYGRIELRLHPHNNQKMYGQFRSEQVEVSMEKPLIQSLKEAGIVLCVNSTVMLEALAFGRPVITLDWHPSPFEQPVRNVVTHCRNLNELGEILSCWRNNPPKNLSPPIGDVRKEIESFIACTGQESKSRIVAAIEQFMR
jgi:hypothetical protein